MNLNSNYIFIILFVCLGPYAKAYTQSQPSSDHNYIMTTVFFSPDTTGNMNNVAHNSSVSYYDGLGRLAQTVSVNAAGSSESAIDIVSDITYNNMGYVYREWNPAININGGGEYAYVTDELSGDVEPYKLFSYEPTPTSRISESWGAGQIWHNHQGRKTEYSLNSVSGSYPCMKLIIGNNGIQYDGLWTDGELTVVNNKDEDGKRNVVFTDRLGNKVMESSLSGGEDKSLLGTYYVYDKKGYLRYVIPPLMSQEFIGHSAGFTIRDTSTTTNSLAYKYEYDGRGHLKTKKLPGKSQEYLVTDINGDVIMSQDGNQRKTNCWTVFARDSLSRIAYNAEVRLPGVTHSQLMETFMHDGLRIPSCGNGPVLGYNSILGIDSSSVQIVNFNDNYMFLERFADGDSLAYKAKANYDAKYNAEDCEHLSAHGKMTGKATRVLGTNIMLVSSVFYDYKGNVIQTHEQNLLGGYEHYYYRLSFTGKPLEVRHEHTTADTINVEILRYTYDNMERLLTTTVERDGAEPVLLCSNTYDDLGRMATHSLGGTAEGSHAESLAYAYNVRGWTTGIAGSNFSQTLHYEDAGENACYNGNIGSVEWSAKELIDETTRVSQQYSYTYDGLNRLVSAAYSAPGASDWDNTFIANNPRDYSSSYTYDLNGNLTAIKRKGVAGKVNVFDYTFVSFDDIDDLSLEYNGNQLKKVSDQCDDLTYEGAMEFKDGATKATEYTYDANGNMTSDRNKGIHSISYNILNLPGEVVFDDGHVTRYTYTADGRKLKVEYLLNNVRFDEPIVRPISPISGYSGISPMAFGGEEILIPRDSLVVFPQETTLMTRDYCGNHIYRNGVLERVLNDVGYADSIGYHYQVKDYRGDVRAVVAQNGTLEETNSYYPYGMLHGTSAIASTQPYKYTGKELDRENGLDWYDFEARMLMSDLGRTTTMDPLAEKYYGISPYLWCGGNPITFHDENGLYPKDSKISYVGNGVFQLNIAAFSSFFQNQFYKIKENTEYWTPGEIGINLTVEKVQVTSDYHSYTLNTDYTPIGIQDSESQLKTKAVMANSTKLPDRRVKPRVVTTANCGKGISIAMLGINFLISALDTYAIYTLNNELIDLNNQKYELKKAANLVINYVSNNKLPKKYMTPDMLGAIINYIFQGENTINDKNIKYYGEKIRNSVK